MKLNNCPKCGADIPETMTMCPGCMCKEKGEAYKLGWNQAYEAALQILHGGLLPSDITLPTANEVALIIMNTCNLEKLQSIHLAEQQSVEAHEWALKNLRCVEHDKSKWSGQLDTE